MNRRPAVMLNIGSSFALIAMALAGTTIPPPERESSKVNRETAEERVAKFQGVLASPTLCFLDGHKYEYSAYFDDDESADAFIEENFKDLDGSARDMIDGRLTLFFSFNG